MAYTPKADRAVKNGVAQVSAKELADFRKMYGEDKTLRDLLNMDKGLERKGDREQAAAKAASIREADDARAAARDAARDAMQARGRAMTEANYAPRRSAAQQVEGKDDTYNPDVKRGMNAENKDTSDMSTMKKGGAVKGWGIARGARKAKIY